MLQRTSYSALTLPRQWEPEVITGANITKARRTATDRARGAARWRPVRIAAGLILGVFAYGEQRQADVLVGALRLEEI
jgi:hypothetical protein